MAKQTITRFEASAEKDDRLKALLMACARRDEQAFAHLYQSTSSILFGVLLRILKRSDLARDCLQEVYLKIWRHADEYRPYAAEPLTWMLAIARHQAIDLLRGRNRELLRVRQHESTEQSGFEVSVEERITAGSDESRLDNCLRQLKSEQRQIFALAYYKGLSHMELAQQTALPVGTVKTWIRRGLKSLRQCMRS